ncbi:Transcriptional regulator [Blastocladiella emersonii ATCC 22665]|nr:Transcriptional regulator [Blastocladiella emersonii ATCC 22665]
MTPAGNNHTDHANGSALPPPPPVPPPLPPLPPQPPLPPLQRVVVGAGGGSSSAGDPPPPPPPHPVPPRSPSRSPARHHAPPPPPPSLGPVANWRTVAGLPPAPARALLPQAAAQTSYLFHMHLPDDDEDEPAHIPAQDGLDALAKEMAALLALATARAGDMDREISAIERWIALARGGAAGVGPFSPGPPGVVEQVVVGACAGASAHSSRDSLTDLGSTTANTSAEASSAATPNVHASARPTSAGKWGAPSSGLPPQPPPPSSAFPPHSAAPIGIGKRPPEPATTSAGPETHLLPPPPLIPPSGIKREGGLPPTPEPLAKRRKVGGAGEHPAAPPPPKIKIKLEGPDAAAARKAAAAVAAVAASSASASVGPIAGKFPGGSADVFHAPPPQLPPQPAAQPPVFPLPSGSASAAVPGALPPPTAAGPVNPKKRRHDKQGRDRGSSSSSSSSAAGNLLKKQATGAAPGARDARSSSPAPANPATTASAANPPVPPPVRRGETRVTYTDRAYYYRNFLPPFDALPVTETLRGDDYSRATAAAAKNAQQTLATTFWAYMDPWLRPIAEDDLAALVPPQAVGEQQQPTPPLPSLRHGGGAGGVDDVIAPEDVRFFIVPPLGAPAPPPAAAGATHPPTPAVGPGSALGPDAAAAAAVPLALPLAPGNPFAATSAPAPAPPGLPALPPPPPGVALQTTAAIAAGALGLSARPDPSVADAALAFDRMHTRPAGGDATAPAAAPVSARYPWATTPGRAPPLAERLLACLLPDPWPMAAGAAAAAAAAAAGVDSDGEDDLSDEEGGEDGDDGGSGGVMMDVDGVVDVPQLQLAPAAGEEESGAGGAVVRGGIFARIVANGEVESLENRLKGELRAIGVLHDEELPTGSGDDDPVAETLRAAQRALRAQMAVNRARRARVLELARKRLAYQEYRAILDETDRALEKAFTARYTTKPPPKKSKKKDRSRSGTVDDTASGSGTLPADAVAAAEVASGLGAPPVGLPPFPDAVVQLMEKRRALIATVGVAFDSDEFARTPAESVFADIAPNVPLAEVGPVVGGRLQAAGPFSGVAVAAAASAPSSATAGPAADG